MSDVTTISTVVIDLIILGCLVVAIGLGSVLLWQILKLKKEQFKFDQMSKSMNGQIAIFQSALESGKLDLEVKIERMNKAIRVAQNILDDMHELTSGQSSNVTSITKQAPSRTSPPLSKKPIAIEEDRDDAPRPMFSIMDPEFENELKEDASPAMEDYDDLSEADKRELAKLGTPAEKALMAALKRAGRG